MLVMTTIFISKMEGLPPTSDIRLIDLWLVICQMVPFAEVVLLTAMECQSNEEGGDISRCVQVVPIDEEENDLIIPERKRWFQNCGLVCSTPRLKTLGKLNVYGFSQD